jgi:putative phosphoribosyl transferase
VLLSPAQAHGPPERTMHVVYRDRIEAGKRLAKRLQAFHGTDALVMAIPMGGIPVAATVAHRLDLEWGVIVTRKLPIPWNPEAGFGAVAADGTVVLNDEMVRGLRLSHAQVDEVAEQVRAEVARRQEVLSRERPPVDPSGRTVIVVDDGLASGYTMLAAMNSLRRRSAQKVIAAAPVASRSAATLVEEAADECVFDIVSPAMPFAVADFYVEWHDLGNGEALEFLRSPARGAVSRQSQS